MPRPTPSKSPRPVRAGRSSLAGWVASLVMAWGCVDDPGALRPGGHGTADTQPPLATSDGGIDAGVRPDAEADAGPIDVPPARPVGRSLAAGIYFSCARAADSTVECWGGNERGMLGVGDEEPRAGRVTVLGLRDVLEISAGVGHTCARRTDGSVWCWGRNDYGGLGDGTLVDRNQPVRVVGLEGVDHLSAGSWHTCALDEMQSVWCWGWNAWGQAGSSEGELQRTPVEILGLGGVVQLAAGRDFTCALLEDASVECWGQIFPEDLGATPVAIEGLRDVRSLAAGYDYVCALLADGSARCWGANPNGELGDGTRTHRAEPTRVVGVSSAEQASASFFTSVLLADGRAAIVGPAGPSGLPTHPAPVAGIENAVEIVNGGYQVCVRLDDFGVRCFGDNGRGQAGGCCFEAVCSLPEGAACGEGPSSLGICTNGWCSDCGAESQPCCAATRPEGQRCRNDRLLCDAVERCVACGGLGEPCCPGGCRDADAVCFEDTCTLPGLPGAPCLSNNGCNQGCCTLTDHSTRLCIAAGATCPGQAAGACTPNGSCGACGGPGQPCCATTESTRIPWYCSAPDTACQQQTCIVH